MTNFFRIMMGIAIILTSSPTNTIQINNPDRLASVEVIESTANGIKIEMIAPGYLLQQETINSNVFDQLTVRGADVNAIPGTPEIPILSVLVGVPPTADISLEILFDQVWRIPGSFSLAPAPVPIGIGNDLMPGKFDQIPNEDVYETDTLYPDLPVLIEDDVWLRDQRIIRIAFYPIQYNPKNGQLIWHQNLQVRVNFQTAISEIGPTGSVEVRNQAGEDRIKDNSPFETILQEKILNYDSAKNWRSLERPLFNQISSYPELQTEGLKITVNKDGLYKLTGQDLRGAGLNLWGVDPANFHMTNQGQDVGIYFSGDDDSRFERDEYFIFYGQYFRGDRMAQIYADEDQNWLDQFVYFSDGSTINWDAQLNATMFEKYTEENVYWLSVEGTPGLRMPEVDGTPGTAETPVFFPETIHREESHEWWTWHFTGEDTWFWQTLKPNIWTKPSVTGTYTATLTALATGEYTPTVRGEVVARNFNNSGSPDHHTQVFINGQTTPIDDATWDGHVRYAFETQTPLSSLVEGENVLDFVVNMTGTMVADNVYFDWFEIEYPKLFEASDNQLFFTNNQGGTYKYQSHGFSNNEIEIFNITHPIMPTRILNSVVTTNGPGSYSVTFESTQDDNERYFIAAVGDDDVFFQPLNISYYEPQDYSSLSGVDYVFITHQELMNATQTLANYRESQGLSTMVVDINELYNQFNYGIYHPIAIKSFLAYTFDNWSVPPSYALLVGGGHWNMLGHQGWSTNYEGGPIFIPPNLAFVDPWQGEVDSANLLATVVGDDILPDLAIGLMPVNNSADLNVAIDKIISFESQSRQDWHQNILFVADNVPDAAGDFVESSENIINNNLSIFYEPIRIYENDFNCSSAYTPACYAATNAITSTINFTGALFVNYTGHGDPGNWSDEKVFNTSHLPTLNNSSKLSIFLDLTCLTGYWYHPNPGTRSLAVELLILEDAGAVSTFSPTGLGVGQGHEILNAGFYDALFKSGIETLGGATIQAKVNLFNSGSHFDLINTFTVFGDPALGLPIIKGIYLPIIAK